MNTKVRSLILAATILFPVFNSEAVSVSKATVAEMISAATKKTAETASAAATTAANQVAKDFSLWSHIRESVKAGAKKFFIEEKTSTNRFGNETAYRDLTPQGFATIVVGTYAALFGTLFFAIHKAEQADAANRKKAYRISDIKSLYAKLKIKAEDGTLSTKEKALMEKIETVLFQHCENNTELSPTLTKQADKLIKKNREKETVQKPWHEAYRPYEPAKVVA